MFVGIIIPRKINNSIFLNIYEEFIKRINGYTNIMCCDFKSKYKENNSKELDYIGNKMISIAKDGYKVAFDAEGYMMDTISFSNWLEDKLMGEKKLYFIIGGSFGIPKKVKSHSNEVLSFSKLTFSHEIALVILLEQIYRAFTIINGHPYNK